jgi:hypothetical protein
MINVFFIICYMRKYLFLLICFFTTTLSAQYKTTNITTNVLTTSRMIWNYQTEKWDFTSNDDVKDFVTDWTFNVNSSNQGMVSNGTVNYDILEYTYIDETMVMLKLYNVKVSRKMDMIVSKKDGKIVISIFDYDQRTAYYFL